MMHKRFSFNSFGGNKRKEEMERVRQENERLQTALQQERAETERKDRLRLDQQAQLKRQLAQEKADREAREKLEWERWEREERDRMDKLAKQQRQRDEYMRRLRYVSPDSLCALRELIRARYALDVEIWGL